MGIGDWGLGIGDWALNEDNFWKHCFNLTGGEKNRITGFETVEESKYHP